MQLHSKSLDLTHDAPSSSTAPDVLATETPATGPAPGKGCAGSGEASFSIQTQKENTDGREEGEKLESTGGREREWQGGSGERECKGKRGNWPIWV